MENQPKTLNKVAKISIIVGALIIALSTAYYLVVFLPQKEKASKLQALEDEMDFEANLRKYDLEEEEREATERRHREILKTLEKGFQDVVEAVNKISR